MDRAAAFVRRVQASVVHYGRSTGFFADKMFARGPAYLSAAVLYENLVVESALDARYASCLTALDELMPDGVRWTHPGGGPTLWLELPRSVDLPALEAHLARRGIQVSNASAAYVGPAHLH